MTATKEPAVIEAMRAATLVAKRAADLLSATRFEANKLDEMRILCVCTIVDGLWGLIALIDSLGQGHVFTVLRTMVESHGDLHHLMGADATLYLDRLKLTSAIKSKKEAEDLIKLRQDGDPVSNQVRDMAEQARDAANAVIEESQKVRQLKPLRVVDRVAGPGIGEDVLGVYSMLCFEGHNDHTALERRHLRGNSVVFGNETLTATTVVQALAIGCLLTYASMAGINTVSTTPHLQLSNWSNEMQAITERLFKKHGELVRAGMVAQGITPAVNAPNSA